MDRENERRRKNSGVRESDIKKLIHLLDTIERGIELLYYLLDNKRQKSFVVALLSANNIDLDAHIQHQKRDTDVLFEIDRSENRFAILCQGTEVDGGYYFMQRLVKTIEEKGGTEVYCSEIEVTDTTHPIQEIAFRLLNMYQRVKAQKADGEISFHSLK